MPGPNAFTARHATRLQQLVAATHGGLPVASNLRLRGVEERRRLLLQAMERSGEQSAALRRNSLRDVRLDARTLLARLVERLQLLCALAARLVRATSLVSSSSSATLLAL